jgi:hypothetical protein
MTATNAASIASSTRMNRRVRRNSHGYNRLFDDGASDNVTSDDVATWLMVVAA